MLLYGSGYKLGHNLADASFPLVEFVELGKDDFLKPDLENCAER
jgi:hypothetical protein